MDDVHLREGQVCERLEDLARKLPDQLEGDSAEVGLAYELIEVVGQVLKYDARVADVVECLLEAHCKG